MPTKTITEPNSLLAELWARLRVMWPMLIGLVVFGFALWFIHRELAHFHVHQILRQIAAIPVQTIALAVAATASSYLALTLFDWLALTWIGHRFTYRRIALASFTSYTLAHNVGFGMLSGGAVRYKLYGSWGLSVADIAKVIVFVTLTTALGMSTILGVAAIGEGKRLMELVSMPGWFGPIFGAIVLLLPLTWLALASFKVGKLTWRQYEVSVPHVPIAAGQILISIVDNSFAALTLYILLPDSIGFGLLGFLGLFVVANTIGIISHVPGGVGVFDATILLAVPSDASGATVAALVAYRVIYYLVPLAISCLLIAAHTLGRPSRTMLARTLPLAPSLFAVLVFVSGLILLISGVTPVIKARADWLLHIVPLGVIEVSHFLGSLMGVALLLIADGLRRRLDGAWLLACGFLSAGIVFSLLKGFDFEEALGLGITLVALLPCRHAFNRKARLFALTPTPGWLLASAAALAGCLWLGFFAYQRVEYADDLWWSFVVHGDAPRFLRASVGAVIAFLIVCLYTVLRPAPVSVLLPEETDLPQVENVIQHAEGASTSACLALLGDKRFLFSPSGRSFIMFGVQGHSWIAMGEPVGLQEEQQDLIWSFMEICHQHAGRPAFYQITPDTMPVLAEVGLAFQKLGEQAYVSLPQFDLQGPGRAKLRQTWNRGQRLPLVFEVVAKADVLAITDELKRISDQWLRGKNAREKGFSLGRFNVDYICHFPVAILRLEGRIIAFANLWAASDHSEISVDLMRQVDDAPNGVMEYLFIALMLWGREQGYAEFDMGMAPMAGLDGRASAPMLSRAGALIYRHAEHFYNFQGLRAYKEKFSPEWRSRYLAARPGIEMTRMLGDTTLLVSGGVKGLISR
ncbi:bifunctional lysylphosphatidylglycerol flippase/synthetase MprF [Pusillimonas sp. ANT_WB101]|uniref:bifunctional lysylphosphatidylglycerol flippase/synthetase MprF n=1 Tax=Pusillimonas sp. ANT_WB101 TaxID=2597356 RepID=UPI0011EEF2AE|nr:bifunctional lysylphosphatidylglycerol flippase/synthetase MprF [Pusillimonas sp. ANT_WB101]KAA0911156.1 bifunctional lysylphosphatidylglycerol flippase/synthetase MprF [Pusillimonas sp. ANT_WB101]